MTNQLINFKADDKIIVALDSLAKLRGIGRSALIRSIIMKEILSESEKQTTKPEGIP